MTKLGARSRAHLVAKALGDEALARLNQSSRGSSLSAKEPTSSSRGSVSSPSAKEPTSSSRGSVSSPSAKEPTSSSRGSVSSPSAKEPTSSSSRQRLLALSGRADVGMLAVRLHGHLSSLARASRLRLDARNEQGRTSAHGVIPVGLERHHRGRPESAASIRSRRRATVIASIMRSATLLPRSSPILCLGNGETVAYQTE